MKKIIFLFKTIIFSLRNEGFRVLSGNILKFFPGRKHAAKLYRSNGIQVQIEYVYWTPVKILFKGWASASNEISRIAINVSGHSFQIPYGQLRPDIASRYNVPEHSGFGLLTQHEDLSMEDFAKAVISVELEGGRGITFERNLKQLILESEYKPSIKGLKNARSFDKASKIEGISKYCIDILIPFKNEKRLLQNLIESIFKHSENSDYKIYLLDNDSDDTDTKAYIRELTTKKEVDIIHIPCNFPFNFSKMINNGINNSNSELILLLNNDIEVITHDWLQLLANNFKDDTVSVVGSKLIYPDNTIQHSGIVLSRRILTRHIWNHFPNSNDSEHHMNQKRLVSAVTGATMMIRRADLEVFGLLDEELQVTLNDVDLCLRAQKSKKKVLYDPGVTLIHHESYSRGDNDHLEEFERTGQEVRHFKKRWANYLSKGDPYE